MNIEYYLKSIVEENSNDDIVREVGLYEDIDNIYFKEFFALAHHEINRLFFYLNSKLKSGWYNAEQSRQLLRWIKIVEDSIFALNKTESPIEIKNDYMNIMEKCKQFLVISGGSPIPADFPKIDILEFEPIFSFANSIEIINSEKKNKASMKLIGEGSYAKVFKFTDAFYNKNFVLKRAKKDLIEKELIRFKKEFDTMKSLNSPYIIEVYCFDDKANEYIMEYADQTIYDFISINNGILKIPERICLVNQVIKGFEYVNSKELLHRDISLTNVLVKDYDGLKIIKISDFGLVKTKESTLTSFGTEFKGSLNDPALEIIGFDKYNIIHETYALTRLIFFIMTGKVSLEGIKDKKIKDFVNIGVHSDNAKRYQNFDELKFAFKSAFYI